MKTSEPCSDLIAALAQARLAFPAIVRNQSAIAKGGRTYHYADLSAIADATSGVLAQHGLVLVQAVEDGEAGQLCISSTLYHTSGQWLREALSVAKPGSMQEIGSVSTYVRRYQQSALLNLATEDDDDAASTLGATTEPAPSKTVAPPASSNGQDHTPAPAPTEGHARPTLAQIETLRTLALVDCGTEEEEFQVWVRRLMGLKPDASVAPKLLTRTLSMAVYEELIAFYSRLKMQLARKTPEDSAHEPTAQTAAVTEPTPSAPEETPAAVPSQAESWSASGAEADRARLRAEVATWMLRVNDQEVEHIIAHHPYARARALLWKARLQPSGEALVAD